MSDANVMFDLRQQISQATSKADLDEIREDLPNYIENKILTPGDAATISNETTAARSQDTKSYSH